LQKNDFGEAIACFDKVLEHNAQDVGALTLRGYARVQAGEFQEALEDFNSVIRIDPTISSAWNHRGLCKKELGNYRGALSDFSWALELNPQNREAWHNRAVLKFFYLNDVAGACHDWHKADSLGHAPAKTLWERYCNPTEKVKKEPT
jgi:tetratricopeptide (TPR) repeat protein